MCSKTFVKAIGKNKGALLIIQFKLVLDKPKAYQIYSTSTLRVMRVVLHRSNVRQLYNYKFFGKKFRSQPLDRLDTRARDNSL